jgi:hypothetical protein
MPLLHCCAERRRRAEHTATATRAPPTSPGLLEIHHRGRNPPPPVVQRSPTSPSRGQRSTFPVASPPRPPEVELPLRVVELGVDTTHFARSPHVDSAPGQSSSSHALPLLLRRDGVRAPSRCRCRAGPEDGPSALPPASRLGGGWATLPSPPALRWIPAAAAPLGLDSGAAARSARLGA